MPNTAPIKETKEYYYDQLGNLSARVYFEKTNRGWEFVRCDYTTTHNPYNLADWDFLVSVGKWIEEIRMTLT